jgi:hypothetical protein
VGNVIITLALQLPGDLPSALHGYYNGIITDTHVTGTTQA